MSRFYGSLCKCWQYGKQCSPPVTNKWQSNRPDHSRWATRNWASWDCAWCTETLHSTWHRRTWSSSEETHTAATLSWLPSAWLILHHTQTSAALTTLINTDKNNNPTYNVYWVKEFQVRGADTTWIYRQMDCQWDVHWLRRLRFKPRFKVTNTAVTLTVADISFHILAPQQLKECWL